MKLLQKYYWIPFLALLIGTVFPLMSGCGTRELIEITVPGMEAPQTAIPEDGDSNSNETPSGGYQDGATDSLRGVSFTIYAGEEKDVLDAIFSVGENEVWKQISARTGTLLNFKSVAFPDMRREYESMFASKDYPDAVQNLTDYYIKGVSAAIEDGIIIDLLPLLDEWAPNLSSYLKRNGVDIRHVLTDEGAMPYIPRVMEQSSCEIEGPILRADWLDELELELPRTYDDYHNVLTAFKENYGATLWLNSIGDMRWNAWSGGFGTAGDLYIDENQNRYPFFVKDDKVIWGPTTKEYESYIRMLAEWYEEGLIYEDSFKENSQYAPIELVQDGTVGVFVAGHADLDEYAAVESGEKLQLTGGYVPVRFYGDINHFDGNNGEFILTDSNFSITTACQYPELLMSLFDYRFSDEGAMLANYGKLGVSYEFVDGNVKFTELIIGQGKTSPDPVARSKYLSSPGAYPEFQRIYEQNYSESASALPDIWRVGRDGAYEIPESITLTASESGRFETVMSGISQILLSEIPRFITGELPITDFSDFQMKQIDMGIEMCVEIYQAAYDRWLNRSEGAIS